MSDNDERPAEPEKPKQPYGGAENYGSPGGDEPPPSTDPASGSAGEARERTGKPAPR